VGIFVAPAIAKSHGSAFEVGRQMGAPAFHRSGQPPL